MNIDFLNTGSDKDYWLKKDGSRIISEKIFLSKTYFKTSALKLSKVRLFMCFVTLKIELRSYTFLDTNSLTFQKFDQLVDNNDAFSCGSEVTL